MAITPRILLAAAACLPSSLAAAQCGPEWVRLEAAGPTARSAAAAYDNALGRVVLAGGFISTPAGDVYSDETWEWDGAAWQLLPDTLPTPRSMRAISYDSGSGGIIALGGSSHATIADVLRFDGLGWSALPAGGPGARDNGALVFDEARGVGVHLGGNNCCQVFGETWEWDGDFWELRPPGGPGARSGVHAAWHPAIQQVVVFGGFSPGLGDRADTWTWDGNQWAELAAATAPAARSFGGMASDPSADRVILFGGKAGVEELFNDTWLFDGQSWSPLETADAPSPRYGFAMAYDAAREAVVVFGGVGPGPGADRPFYDDTWVLTSRPVVVRQAANVSVCRGGAAEFTVVGGGPGPLAYQWFHDDEPIEGEQSDTLLLPLLLMVDAGEYRCVVSNECGSVTSAAAVLALDFCCPADVNGDGVVTVPDIFYFLSYWFAGDIAHANFNSDCCINVNDIFDFLTAWFAGCP
ncbi:MAG: hypothetical protein KF699_16690 [Phycisphaeraceae bacterium]|nr:hypothetical protein [Phycisphaeraceae bacterium]